MRVRIGLSDTSREVEVVVDDVEAFIKELEQAVEAGKAMLWADDGDGHQYGIAAAKIAYVHVEGDRERIVGFG